MIYQLSNIYMHTHVYILYIINNIHDVIHIHCIYNPKCIELYSYLFLKYVNIFCIFPAYKPKTPDEKHSLISFLHMCFINVKRRERESVCD